MKEFCPESPVILVGCKKDLRNDSQTIDMLQRRRQTVVSPEQVCHSCSSGVGIKLTTHFPLVSILLSFMITPVGRICDMEGQAAAYKIGAHSFHECSAVTWEGVEELFELAVRATLIRVKPPKPRTCVIM